MDKELTGEQIAYAYKWLECKITASHIVAMTPERLEDLQSYCMRKLIIKWKHYDPQRTTWRTYMCVILKSALQDGVKWYYRQHQRIIYEPLEDHDAECRDTDIDEIIDDLIEDELLNKLCKMRYGGMSQREIMTNLNLTKVEYESSMTKLYKILKNRK